MLEALFALSRADKYYGYLALVPPVFVTLWWVSRDRQGTVAGHGRSLGGVLVLLGLALLAFGRSTASLQAQSLSLVLVVAGVTLWLGGVGRSRGAGYPLIFLLFLVPVPRELFDAVTLDVQRFLTTAAGAVLAGAGIPVRLEETAIHLPDLTLLIVEGCNGLRFLMGLVVLMAGAAGVLVSSGWGRALVVALAVPAAVAANVIRIAATGFAGHWFGAGAAQGTPHEVLSKAVWIGALVSLTGLTWYIGRRRVLRSPSSPT